MRSTFWQIAFLRVKVLKIVTLAWNSLQKGKTVRFSWKLYKTLFPDHAQHVLPKSHFWGSNFWKSLHLPKFSSKRENSALFMKIVQNALFRSCAARIGQIAFVSVKVLKIVSHTGLKFSSKRENSALFMKIVQNPLFRSCAARFGQIAFLGVKLLKVVTLVSNSLQNGKTVRFPWKLYKTFFLGHAQHVLAKSHLWASKLSKSAHWPQFSPKRENSALFMKIVQNPLFRSCRARFG